MDLARKMSRSEFNKLSDDEKKERKRLQQLKYSKKYREDNPEYFKKYREDNPEYFKKYREENSEQLKESNKKYREENSEKLKEYNREYRETPTGKKNRTLADWKYNCLQETQENLDRIYELWQTQECCNACDCVLTRDGDRSSTQASMDHDHITNRFRHIICHSCNSHDNWKKYFC
tara:strand:- start:735 stop:1262 length:528 start_codon:yes stop_codon:yes gene_type:complete